MPKSQLRLLAEDADDLGVLSAACQDALVRVGDIVFDRPQRRFSLLVSRFRWETASARGPYERIRAGLAFESVLGVKARQVRMDDPEAVASILSVQFAPSADPPSGVVTLTLAGGGAIALDVECLDALLVDTGPSWPTPNRPDHER